MGILTDYLRAPDTDAVVRAMREQEQEDKFLNGDLDIDLPEDELDDPSFGEGLAALDRIDVHGMHDDGLLTALIAVISGAPPDDGLVEETVWPTTPPPGPEGPGEDDPWATGPWVSRFGSGVRDALAGVEDAELTATAERWARTDVVREYGIEPGICREIVERVVRFAREARDNDEQLFSWVCL